MTTTPMAALDLWCEHAWLGGPSATRGVVLRIEGERIVSAIGGVPSAPAGAAALEGLTLPGLANGHVRSAHRVLRGTSPARLGDALATTAMPEPEALLLLARAVYAELALAGYTMVCEFVTHARADHLDALVQAAGDAGVRLALADAWSADIAPRAWVQRVDTFAESVMRRTDVHFVAAAAGLTAEGVQAMGEMPVWAAQMGVPLHVAARRLDDAAEVLAALGRTGVLGHRGGCTVIAPGFTGDDELTALGHQRGFVSVDPQMPTSHRLPVAALRGSGGRLVLANDVHSVADPFAALRALARIARQAARPMEMGTTELLRAATVDAAASLGWRDSGVLASGHLADLVTVSVTAPRFAGVDPDDLLDGVLAVATPADITHVAVGGRLIVDHGRHLIGDVRAHLDGALAGLGAHHTHLLNA